MLRKFALASVLAVFTAAPALAQSCSEPIPPAAPNGATATQKQIQDAAHDGNMFQKQADEYIDCLNDDLKARQRQAIKDKKQPDPSWVDEANSKIDEVQRTKLRVGQEINGAVHSFCQAHPTTAGCDKVLAPPPAAPTGN